MAHLLESNQQKKGADLVIPAQAGTQGVATAHQSRHWIPAFAGMTEKRR